MVITCGMCGRDFEEDRSQPVCRACPLGEGCGLVRCPHCGYENPAAPDWIEAVKAWVGGMRSGGDAAGREDAA